MPTLSGFTVIFGDRVKETTQTTGTGTYTLDGAATGFRTFVAGIGNGNRTVYTAVLGSSYEIGIGTVATGAPANLSRDAILVSSNSNNAVVWSPGVKDIFCDVPAALVSQISSGAFTSIKSTLVTATGTFTRDSKCISARVRIVGGGGGGGAASVSGAGQAAEGAGGGGGEYAEGVFTAAQIGSSLAVTIGAGGTGTNGAGNNGGTTSFGGLMSALGGTGGATVVATSTNGTALGGAGGFGGSGGTFRIRGDYGGIGRVTDASVHFSNYGGGTVLGASSNTSTGTGNPGRAYGGGGSGASHGQNTAVEQGGAGASGVCIIEEYLAP